MTVAEVNALLYLPGHPKIELEKALRIPGLSAGWRDSFRALIERPQTGGVMTGNPGLTPTAGLPSSKRCRAAQPICYVSPAPADRPLRDFAAAITRRKSATDFVTPSIGGNARSSCSIDNTSS